MANKVLVETIFAPLEGENIPSILGYANVLLHGDGNDEQFLLYFLRFLHPQT